MRFRFLLLFLVAAGVGSAQAHVLGVPFCKAKKETTLEEELLYQKAEKDLVWVSQEKLLIELENYWNARLKASGPFDRAKMKANLACRISSVELQAAGDSGLPSDVYAVTLGITSSDRPDTQVSVAK